MRDLPAVCRIAPDLLTLPDGVSNQLPDALGIAALSARETFNIALSDQCLARLRELHAPEDMLTIYSFVLEASSGDEQRIVGALDELRSAYERNRESARAYSTPS